MKTLLALAPLLALQHPAPACALEQDSAQEGPKAERQRRKPSSREQDPLSILAGKLLAFAVSSKDEVATTPPGKWANVFGFTYFRYTERGSGHKKTSLNGMIGRMADGVASIIGEEKARSLAALSASQSKVEAAAIGAREAISRGLYAWRQGPFEGEAEARAELLALGKANGERLADLLEERIPRYRAVLESLDASQLEQLARLRAGNYDGPLDLSVRKLAPSREAKQVSTLILGKFLTWSTSTHEMASLIDAGRPAVFFGFAGLRLANRESSKVSSGLRRNASRVLLATLDEEQREALSAIVKEQETLLELYLSTRGALCALLNPKEWTQSGEPEWDEVRALCVVSEVTEVRLGLLQARRMGSLLATLTDEQRAELGQFNVDASGEKRSAGGGQKRQRGRK